MRFRPLVLLGAILLATACGDDPQGSMSLVEPQLTILSQWSGTLTGEDSITQVGAYDYELCGTGLLPLDGLVAAISTTEHGVIARGRLYPSDRCLTGRAWVWWSTPDFTVTGYLAENLGDFLYVYLPVTVDIPEPPPQPLSVIIEGDDQVEPDETCSWYANTGGGTSPYSWSWGGGISGTTQLIEGSLSQSGYIWVQVTDANSDTATDSLLVSVDEAYQCENK